MEIDQILKRVEWLENQRRKDKDQIAAMESRILDMEGALHIAQDQVKELTGEVTHLSTIVARVGNFEVQLNQYRLEFSRSVEEIEKSRSEREREVEEVRRVQLDGINNYLIDLRKGLEPIPDLGDKMKARVQEEMRLARLIEETREELRNLKRDEDEWNRSLRLLEEGSRRDNKRLTDMQGEMLALRKRVDEHRGRIDLADDGLRKYTTRLNEIVSLESERRDNLNQFLEKQNLAQVDRDRRWKEWQTRFDTIEKQAMELEGHLQGLHVASRDIKRTQEAVEAVTERVERRINEITEMQRLAEDRFRQEWVTFKADDQKRWTNYSLTQEEYSRETLRQHTRLEERVTKLGDSLQEVHDLVEQMQNQVEKQLQGLLSLSRDWVVEFERVFGRSRSA